MTKLLILGATGGTGRLIAAEAATRGHEVTVLARSPDKAQGLGRVIEGDARDPKALARALTGQEVVISALGTPASPFAPITALSVATRVLVEAMQAQGLRRVIAITGLGAGDSRGHGGFLFDRLIFPVLLRHVYADKDRQETILRESGLDWTILRPMILTNGPACPVRATTDLKGIHGGNISRASVARFALDQLESDGWLQQSPLLMA